ncbi:MAG: TM2 domain-containing protein, partial [Myxococcota bacterium]
MFPKDSEQSVSQRTGRTPPEQTTGGPPSYNREDPSLRKQSYDASQANTSYQTAYLLWFFLGILGGHRYYLRRWLSAILYTCTGGFVGLGWLMDFFLTFFMVYERRKQEMGICLEGQPQLIEEVTWAKEYQESTFSKVLLSYRLFLFVLWPALIMMLGTSFQIMPLVFLTMLLLLFSFLVGSVDAALLRAESVHEHPLIQKIPFLSNLLSTIRTFQEFYVEHKPRSVMYYTFFPIVGFPMLLFSKKRRREFRMYWGIFVLIYGSILIEIFRNYGRYYPPYLGVGDAIQYALFAMVILLLMCTSFTMPTVTTCFHLSLTKQRRTLRVTSGIALALSVGILFMVSKEGHTY